MSSSLVESFREYIISRMNCYKMTKANLPVRAELANACEYLEELIENDGWISVDDDLPNHNDFCKVITIYDDLLDCQFFNYTDDGERIIGFSWVNELDIDKNGKFTYSDVENSYGINDVKYFIVLPQPPKE